MEGLESFLGLARRPQQDDEEDGPQPTREDRYGNRYKSALPFR
jgi:hypothetical protein